MVVTRSQQRSASVSEVGAEDVNEEAHAKIALKVEQLERRRKRMNRGKEKMTAKKLKQRPPQERPLPKKEKRIEEESQRKRFRKDLQAMPKQKYLSPANPGQDPADPFAGQPLVLTAEVLRMIMNGNGDKPAAAVKEKEPFEVLIADHNRCFYYPSNLTTFSWANNQLVLDACGMLVWIYRKSEDRTLDPQAFVYAETDSYGHTLNEVTSVWTGLGLPSADVVELAHILRSWVQILGVCDVTHADFNGSLLEPVAGRERYARTIFSMVRPSLLRAQKILHTLSRKIVEVSRGAAAAALYDNYSALTGSVMPFDAGAFVTQMGTKQLSMGNVAGRNIKCSYCGLSLGNTSFQEHNKTCPKSKENKD